MAAAAGRAAPGHRVPFHGGIPVTPDAIVGILLGELLVHGWDLAGALGRPWPIGAAEADAVLDGAEDLLPGWVEPARGGRHTATYELRVRGGRRHRWRFRDGTFAVTDDAAADCRLSVAPPDLLLVLYGRRSPWRSAATGRALSWGRRPWLAMTLHRRFVAV